MSWTKVVKEIVTHISQKNEAVPLVPKKKLQAVVDRSRIINLFSGLEVRKSHPMTSPIIELKRFGIKCEWESNKIIRSKKIGSNFVHGS